MAMTKFICMLEDNSRKYFVKKFVKLFAVTQQKMAISSFPIIRQWKLCGNLCFHSNKSRHVKRIINTIYEEADVINMSVKFQLIPLMAVEKNILGKKPLCYHSNQSNSVI